MVKLSVAQTCQKGKLECLIGINGRLTSFHIPSVNRCYVVREEKASRMNIAIQACQKRANCWKIFQMGKCKGFLHL
jgi:hypothetical protein